ncbi:MAG: PaaI family thioesterase [Pseudomonadales bacterium]|nr:PaaI family thioesterase [Pseudomonadales bacterium]
MSGSLSMLEQMKSIIPVLKQCRVLGIEVVEAEPGHLVLLLPYDRKIVGNPDTGVIHGGPLTTLMDTACGFAAVTALKEPGIAPTLDLRIDYMRSAIPGKPVLGSAEAYRVTRNVIFARGLAYHEGLQEKPIAHCTATFMRIDPAAVNNREKL